MVRQELLEVKSSCFNYVKHDLPNTPAERKLGNVSLRELTQGIVWTVRSMLYSVCSISVEGGRVALVAGAQPLLR